MESADYEDYPRVMAENWWTLLLVNRFSWIMDIYSGL